jgi:hypothetical protein
MGDTYSRMAALYELEDSLQGVQRSKQDGLTTTTPKTTIMMCVLSGHRL